MCMTNTYKSTWKMAPDFLRVIFWRKQKECTAQHHLIDKCNGNRYILVIGEVADYYGVHEIIAFDI
jgi:hypothetical protein